jgi:hypothetical protein
MSQITERYADKIAGVLGCFDRLIITGTLPTLCYADGMTRYLSARRIRIFDFAEWAKPLTAAIKANAEALAEAAGLKIDYIRKKNFRKEDKVKAELKKRGDKPGLVWIFSAGTLHQLAALARSRHAAHLSTLRRWQVLALLLLFHR